MCCSTGLCGPSVDQKLIRLAADVAFFKSQGVVVERFNLGHQPDAFASNPLVLSEMGAEAENLPIYIVDGTILAKGGYPTRSEMASWLDIESLLPPEKSRTKLKMASSKCCESDDSSCC